MPDRGTGTRGGGLGAGPLAVAVLSLNGDRNVVDAVRSLVLQHPRPEIVVVNSGGGELEQVLEQEGLGVPVVQSRERLLPGGARNLGLQSTAAPYVGFLAADCLALPGWVAGRLRAHADGVPAVGSLITNAYPASRSACAASLLLHHRRMAHTPPQERISHGLSYERSLFERFGLFRDDLRVGEDSEFKSRLGKARIPILTSDEVRTAHRNPRTPLALLRDQYGRGARRSRAGAALGVHAGRLPVAAVVDAALAWRWVANEPNLAERRRLRRGWPLILPGAVAYAAGSFSAARENGRGSASCAF